MSVVSVLLVMCLFMSGLAIIAATKNAHKSLFTFQYNTLQTAGFTLGIVHDVYDYDEYTYACVRIGFIFFQIKLETYTVPEVG